MNSPLEIIKYRGFVIKVFPDECPERPDSWDNSDTFLVYDHRQFTVKVNGYDPTDIIEAHEEGKALFNGYFYFPVYAYIHSGIALSLGRGGQFSDRWDTSFQGFALVQRRKGWSWRRDKAFQIAQSLLNEWNQYLSGEVYGYDNDLDSCWGYYGDEGKKQLIEDAKSSIDYHITAEYKKALTHHLHQLKIWLRHHVPIYIRTPFINPFPSL